MLKALLVREAAGLPLNYKAVVKQDRRLHDAVLQIFGRWDAGLLAAGIDPEHTRRCRPWSHLAIITRLQERARQGMSLHRAVVHRDERKLTDAAERYFGCWDDALTAASIDPAPWRRRAPRWTRDSMIAAIQAGWNNGEKLNSTAPLTTRLHTTAIRLFGSWDAALAAAGVDLDRIRVHRRPWTAEELLQEFQRKAAQGRRITLSGSLRYAARRAFGSVGAAAHAAGIDPMRIHKRKRPQRRRQP